MCKCYQVQQRNVVYNVTCTLQTLRRELHCNWCRTNGATGSLSHILRMRKGQRTWEWDMLTMTWVQPTPREHGSGTRVEERPGTTPQRPAGWDRRVWCSDWPIPREFTAGVNMSPPRDGRCHQPHTADPEVSMLLSLLPNRQCPIWFPIKDSNTVIFSFADNGKKMYFKLINSNALHVNCNNL